jgi:hypothetical protein
LQLIRPDGERFLTYVELEQQRRQARLEQQQAQAERDQAEERAAALAAKLRELGVDPESVLGRQDVPPAAE